MVLEWTPHGGRGDGADVLDFGESWGQLALLLLAHEAESVTVIDTSLPCDFYEDQLSTVAGLHTSSSTVEDYSRERAATPRSFDLIIAHTVTEHVMDLPSALAAIYAMLKPGASSSSSMPATIHPGGAHDNLILGPNDEGVYEYSGRGAGTARMGVVPRTSSEHA